MNVINAIIIDDEVNACENLRYLLTEFCKNITIVSEAKNVDDAIIQINKHKPQLIFLDIEMPQKNGFQLLDAFTNINFQIIFVTAYDKYAIKAFEVSAIDYLLKPIDINRLQKAVEKVSKLLISGKKNNKLDLLNDNREKIQKIAIPYKSDYVIVNLRDILCIEADRMYTIIHTINGKKYVAAKKLSYYEDLLCKEQDFLRTHRSWIVNTSAIEMYSKKDKKIQLKNEFEIPISKSYKEKFEAIFFT
ncbi:DNA-binding response regulator [Polaribacter sp. ALD11]|uniref:LytR/AlgR family response regulator transcription factor n=1 Tax=Polaribacter sp. ALD11 TaxID=2058137 RepID=UPI000C308A7D|nr:LytTR family DNA-binding domain-containing protein [Polaribacter sp. ALD11]AUC85093.1 DNA-binding response regulator [Polaribacter sp. ALD11]